MESAMCDIIKNINHLFLGVSFPTPPLILPFKAYFYDVTHDTFMHQPINKSNQLLCTGMNFNHARVDYLLDVISHEIQGVVVHMQLFNIFYYFLESLSFHI